MPGHLINLPWCHSIVQTRTLIYNLSKLSITCAKCIAASELIMHQKWGSYSKATAARLKAKDLNRHMRLYNDPVTNLKTILYGPQVGSTLY